MSEEIILLKRVIRQLLAAIRRHGVLLIMLLLSYWLCRATADVKSPTADEWAHLIRGLSYWMTGDTRLSYAHPPLANALFALPVVVTKGLPDFRTLEGWQTADLSTLTNAYFDACGYAEARGHLILARSVGFWVLAAGAVYVYLWGGVLFGRFAGALAATFVALHPVMLGQARYVTTDLAAAVSVMVAAGEFARWLSGHGRWWSWIVVPLSLSVAVVVKHSGLLLIPIFLSVALGSCLFRLGVYSKGGRRRSFVRWMVQVVVALLVVLLTVNVVYRFQETGVAVKDVLAIDEPQYWVSAPFEGEMLETLTPLPHLPEGMRLPVPYTWLFGVAAVRAQNLRGFPWASFMGTPTPKGHAGYFPLMLLVKTPLVVLLFGGVGVVVMLRARKVPELSVSILVAVMLMFLAFAMRSRLNMGIRHVLPVVTVLSVVCALLYVRAWEVCRRLRSMRWWFAVVAAVSVSAIVAGRGDYLGYYNGLVGREFGHHINVAGDDWGQDRQEFVDLVKMLGLQPLYYDSITSIRAREVEYLGLEFVELECKTDPRAGSFVALHAMRHVGYPNCFAWLKGRVPLLHVNHHVQIYWIPDGEG